MHDCLIITEPNNLYHTMVTNRSSKIFKNFTSSQKQNILHEQAALMDFKNVDERKYSNATIVRAFCYFALSRTAYRRFGENFELPSISTLIRLTSFSKSYDDVAYYFKLLLNLTDQQKTCILLDLI